MTASITRILVVDDDGDLREMMRSLLERAGYDVIAVGSGADALAFLARTPPPCLLVLDMQMDDMSGWEVLDGLAPREGFPVIIVSGAPPRPLRGTPWLRKPVTADQLLAAIDQVTGRLPERANALS